MKVSPKHGTLGPSEERQLSLELTAHTLVSVEPGAALPREAPAVCILASREICLRPLSWAEAGNRFLELGSGVPFLLGLLSRNTGSGRLEQAGIGPETLEHHP